ncbi:hypothetical protein CANARDRAFT_213392 [[Candida] arabinofermentans NRRL YB-2248]|uniref:Uncharacterized protein n=1 Tax=[Candida] arabinofermentans NRRL YB-2248 TaxID=983967 RepID=A0A1E4SYC9_9ASCO|nr:hypothetical protein CANARDRAFT_213392 [[Candida] arabinofermentans NRRL YB-2248]
MTHIRFDGFDKAANYATLQTIKQLSLSTFKSCYPFINTDTLQELNNQLITFMKSKSIEQFNLIYEERNLKLKLDELDDLIHDGESRMINGNGGGDGGDDDSIFINSLNSNQLIQFKLLKLKENAVDELHDKLNNIITEKHKLINELNSLIDKTNNDLNSIDLTRLIQLSEIQTINDDEFDKLIDYII